MRALRIILAAWLALLCMSLPSEALTGGQELLLLGPPAWVLPGASIDMNFGAGQYYGLTPSQLTVSRASAGTAFDAQGSLHSFSANQARITNLGLLVEESRTNTIRNNTMAGAAVGSANPTNWGVSVPSGVTATLIALPIINGMQAAQYTFTGTPTASGWFGFSYDPYLSTATPAAYGQTWTASAFVALSNTTNITTPSNYINAFNGVPAYANTYIGSFSPTSNLTIYSYSFTIATPSVAYLQGNLQFYFTSGQAVNFTATIAAPQLELNSNLPASLAGGAQTITNSGTATCASGTYTVSGGTGTAATLTGLAAGGVITSLTTLTGGSYSVLPPSPAALIGTGCSGSPTVTLTPTNNAPQAFATSPILTSGSAATRAADYITAATAPNSGPSSLYFVGTPSAPSASSTIQTGMEWDGAAGSSRLYFNRTNGYSLGYSVAGGSYVSATNYPTWAPNASGKITVAASSTAVAYKFNGANYSTAAQAGTPQSLNTLYLGSAYFPFCYFNGTIQRAAISPTTSLLNH